MLNYRLGWVNEKHWGFKSVFRCSKPHTICWRRKRKKEKCPFTVSNKAATELTKTTGK